MSSDKHEVELLFHGTRAGAFEIFDMNKLGTGEGAHAADGMYFVTSLKGACNHGMLKAKQSGRPIVYICRFLPTAKVLNIDIPISSHSYDMQLFWDTLPVWVSSRKSKDWYYDIAWTPESSIDSDNTLDERERCRFLRKLGIDAIRNFESGAFADSYLHGRSHILLNPNAIEIIEVLDVQDIHQEISGRAKNYYLEDELKPLGDTEVLSKLRSSNW